MSAYRRIRMSLLGLCLITLTTTAMRVTTAHAQSQERLDKLRYVDIRDLTLYRTDLAGTSKLIMQAISASPQKFTGFSDVQFPIDEASQINLGPKGPIDQNTTPDNAPFQIKASFPETMTNTVLKIGMEDIVEEEFDAVFKIKLALFIHSSQFKAAQPASNGYYFRRLTVRVKARRSDDPVRVALLRVDQDIPLNSTNFRLMGDLLERKVIMEDPELGLRFVFPIAVGSFDVRTGPGQDQVVRLLTQEFLNAKISKTSALNRGSSGWNTRSRLFPSYYKGRPFIGLLQDGNTYEEIGMHYQIDDSGLIRGFVSHGCIRVRDMDLYFLDAVLNEGARPTLNVHFANVLQGYEQIDHPMPKVDTWYNSVVYSNRTDLPARATCPPNGTYDQRYFGGSLHTLADSDCLTMVARNNRPPAEVIDYLKSLSNLSPAPLLDDGNLEEVLEGGFAYRERKIKKSDCQFLGMNCKKKAYAQLPRPSKDASGWEWLAYAEEQLGFHAKIYKDRCDGPKIKKKYRDFCKKERAYLQAMKEYHSQLNSMGYKR